MAEEKEKQMVFTTKLVDDATDKINDGVVVKRYQNPWLKGEVGIRRSGVTFKMSPAEQQEYIRCALDIHYFTEQYCKTKREDGSVGSITLRDYQKDILDNFVNSRFNILMASRQVGKCNQLIRIFLNIIGVVGKCIFTIVCFGNNPCKNRIIINLSLSHSSTSLVFIGINLLPNIKRT